MPTNCQTEISAERGERVVFLAEPGREQALQPDAIEQVGRDAPDRRQDQLPDEADDDEGEDGRDEDRRAVEGREAAAAGWTAAPRAAMPIGFCTSMWMMKNQTLLPSAFQKLADQRGSPNSVRKLSRPTKTRCWSSALNSDSLQRAEQRDDHDRRVDEHAPARGTRRCASGTAAGPARSVVSACHGWPRTYSSAWRMIADPPHHGPIVLSQGTERRRCDTSRLRLLPAGRGVRPADGRRRAGASTAGRATMPRAGLVPALTSPACTSCRGPSAASRRRPRASRCR